jgi:hypothetical protein
MKVLGLRMQNDKNGIKIHETVAGIGTAYVCELCEIVAERCGDFIYFFNLAV